MKYNFDNVISRINTDSWKWDGAPIKFKTEIELPLWVADMDFPSPPTVIDALVKRTRHGIFGYSIIPEEYYSTMTAWFKKRHGWDIERDYIMFCPGIVTAIRNLIQALTRPGDKILIQPPVYHPFARSIKSNNRTLVNNPLRNVEGHYEMDFTDLEIKLKDPGTKMMILCSPHNPVGRAWTREELTRVGSLCLKHKVFVIADEIHSDLVYDGYTHTQFAGISKKFQANSVTCLAPSKTFNLAGLVTANVVIPQKNIRKKFSETLHKNGIGECNPFGITASIVSYKTGEEWLDQVLPYIYDNFLFLKKFLQKKCPAIRVSELEATYLVWLDFRRLRLPADRLSTRLFKEEKVGLNDGRMFGSKEGSGFMRLNIACPRRTLKKALNRIVTAAIR